MSRRSSENRFPFAYWNRSFSIRSSHRSNGTTGTSSSNGGSAHRRLFGGLASLRGASQPELSKRLFKLIKSENSLISAHEAAGRERVSIATQLSEWGDHTGDEAISDISDKVGVVLSELGEQEDGYAHALDDSRGVLKAIRNTEKSVQPSRDNKGKIAEEIAKIKAKEPESARLVILEQELVRAEAENLVAEAQLTNVTRQKLKEAYEAEFRAVIERSEKQALLAKHGLRLLTLLDDTPVVPGDALPAYSHGPHAQQILRDAEDDLHDWRPDTFEAFKANASQLSPGADEDAHIVNANTARADTVSPVLTSEPRPSTGTRNEGPSESFPTEDASGSLVAAHKPMTVEVEG